MHGVRAPIALLLLVAASLAGCTGGGDADGDEPGMGRPGGHGAHGDQDAATHLLAPTWEVGQWWRLESEQSSGPFAHVVSGEAGDHWVVDTDSPDIAFFDARSDISFLGPVRKADLAGSQGAQRVEFFQFPLTPGKNWTTTWDGLPIDIHVAAVEAGKARLQARHENGTPYADYTYDAKTGYFGEYAFYGPDGETVGFGARVTSSGRGFSGDLVRWDVDPVFEQAGAVSDVGFFSNLPVPLTVTDVYAELTVDCTAGSFVAGVAPMPVVTTVAGLDDRGAGTTTGACPLTMAFAGAVGAPRETVPGSTEEQWGYSASGSPASVGTFSFSIFLRTQTLFKAGSAP